MCTSFESMENVKYLAIGKICYHNLFSCITFRYPAWTPDLNLKWYTSDTRVIRVKSERYPRRTVFVCQGVVGNGMELFARGYFCFFGFRLMPFSVSPSHYWKWTIMKTCCDGGLESSSQQNPTRLHSSDSNLGIAGKSIICWTSILMFVCVFIECITVLYRHF